LRVYAGLNHEIPYEENETQRLLFVLIVVEFFPDPKKRLGMRNDHDDGTSFWVDLGHERCLLDCPF
jgi:hypothetical protein